MLPSPAPQRSVSWLTQILPPPPPPLLRPVPKLLFIVQNYQEAGGGDHRAELGSVCLRDRAGGCF